jgi:hypothetical protein
MVQSSIWCCVIAHGCICTVGGLYRVGQLIPKTCWRFMTSHKLMPSCERRRMSGRACNFPRPFNRVWATFRSWRRSAEWLATPTPRYNLHSQERHRIPTILVLITSLVAIAPKQSSASCADSTFWVAMSNSTRKPHKQTHSPYARVQCAS